MKQLLWSSIIVAMAVANIAIQAASAASAPSGPTITTLHGTIIDNHCAAANKDSLATFIKTHTKECALMPDCEASGYSIYTKEGKLHPFLHQNTATIADYLKVKTHTLHAVVKAEMVGDSLKLETIKEMQTSEKPAEKSAKKPM